MSKDSLAQYCQNNKEDYKKELVKEINVFLKKEKKKKATIWSRMIKKIYQKMKNKSLLSIKKYKMRKNALL